MDNYFEIYLDDVLRKSPLPPGDYFLVSYYLSPNGYNAWSPVHNYEVIEINVQGLWNDPYGRFYTNRADADAFLAKVRDEHEDVIVKKMLRDITTASKALKKRNLDKSGRILRSIEDIDKILNNLLPC